VRVALTFNLRRAHTPEQAEFDSRETIAFLTAALASLGHAVLPVEVTCSLRALGRLARAAPELVFNLAEGRRGPFREAFFPAMFEELALPHTGSGASVLSLCLDKALAGRVVAAAGVRVPRGRFVRHTDALALPRLPLIVKPNFEGSSKGITQASVVTRAAALAPTIARALTAHPDGVIVEEYVDGVDVSVAWVDGIGLLPPIGYAYAKTGAHAILDYAKKHGPPDVQTIVPARVDAERLARAARLAFAALGVEGFGRADFRVAADGEPWFLEMNPLPTLAPSDGDLYAAAAAVGRTPRDLLQAIVHAGRRA
jgi:D-alanine-D-alanine ligase